LAPRKLILRKEIDRRNQTVASMPVSLSWHIGKRIRQEIPGELRAGYGK
jgi:hypothetical protein